MTRAARPREAKLSVVVPTLARPSLARSVRSVLEQSSPPSEIIVVANGPLGSDAVEILRKRDLLSELTKVVSLPPRTGPGLSRNIGAWNAVGKYVAFLDDDDEWARDYLEQIEERLRLCPSDLLFGTRMFLDDAGGVLHEKRPEDVPLERWLTVLLSGGNPGVGGQNMVVRRDMFFELGGFEVDLTSGQDRSFTIKALRSGASLSTVNAAVVYLHDPVGYRATGRSSNWFNDTKILADNWSSMDWSTRLRHARMVIARARWIAHQNRRGRTTGSTAEDRPQGAGRPGPGVE